MLFVELGHFERLLALPAQLPTSLSYSVVEILELNVTEVGVVGDDLDDEVGLLGRSDSREDEEVTGEMVVPIRGIVLRHQLATYSPFFHERPYF